VVVGIASGGVEVAGDLDSVTFASPAQPTPTNVRPVNRTTRTGMERGLARAETLSGIHAVLVEQLHEAVLV